MAETADLPLRLAVVRLKRLELESDSSRVVIDAELRACLRALISRDMPIVHVVLELQDADVVELVFGVTVERRPPVPSLPQRRSSAVFV